MNENELKELLRSADDNTVEKIGESCPATDEATKDRIWQKIAAKDSQPADFSQVEISVAEPAKPTHWGRYAVAAAAVLVIGCSAVFALRHMPPMPQEPAAQQSTELQPTESVTETTAADPSPMHEIPAPPQLSEKAAAWLYDALVPQNGLSELTSYEEEQVPPGSAQGIVSALERDFTEDGTPDLLIVRQSEQACILDLYTPTDDSYTLSDSYTCCMAENTPAPIVSISAQDSLLLVSTITKTECENGDPDTHYRRYAVLSAADGTFVETAVLQFVSKKLPGDNQRTGDYYINGKLQTFTADNYHEQFIQTAQASLDALRSGGVRIPDAEVMTDIDSLWHIVRIVSGMIQEQEDIMRHDYASSNTIAAVDFTGLQREQTASTPEEIAYRFVRSDLIPAYGLSDCYATFDLANHQDKGIAPEIPHDAQGIISALVTDLTGDDQPELLTVRAERTILVIDWYRIGNDTCTLAASRTLVGLSPYIYLMDGMLILDSYADTDDSYTSEFSALRLTVDGLEDSLHIVQRYSPEKESITINGEETSAESDALDPEMAEQLTREALDNAGIRYDHLEYVIGSEQPYECHYNFLSIQIPDDAGAILTPGGYSGYRAAGFADHTRLHERLLGKSKLDAPL